MIDAAASHRLTVALAMLSDRGHYTGTFRLARALRARGHHVVYIGLACAREWVTSQGFDFVAFAEDVVPAAGSVSQAPEEQFQAFLTRIRDGTLDQCLRDSGADLVLCDTFVWYIALRALRLGLPVVNLSIILSLYPNAHIPPILSAQPAPHSAVARFRVRSAWAWLRLQFFFTKFIASRVRGTYRAPTRMHHLTDVFRHLAQQAGYPCREGKTYWFGETGPRLALPEVVLCPEAFQLPGKPADGRRYVGDYVDMARTEPPLPPKLADETRPIVYCSLGTCAGLYPHRRRFMAAVVGASRLRPDWLFVLQLSDDQALAQLAATTNLMAVPWVPQLAVLRRAAAMVTHGGLNSIMECVQLGVPMVIMPAARDQPGNAVRAARLGIALTADMARVGADHLVALLDRARADRALKDNQARLRQAIADEDGLAAAVRFIEAQARPAGQGADS